MKTLLILLLLACGLAMAQDCAERPTLTAEYYPNPDRLYMTWRVEGVGGGECFWWYMEQSTNLIHWRTYPGGLTYNCPDGDTNRCFWYTVATNNTPTFYRLRLAPGL